MSRAELELSPIRPAFEWGLPGQLPIRLSGGAAAVGVKSKMLAADGGAEQLIEIELVVADSRKDRSRGDFAELIGHLPVAPRQMPGFCWWLEADDEAIVAIAGGRSARRQAAGGWGG